MRKFQLMTIAMFVGLLVVSLPSAGEAKKKKEMVELAATTKVSIEEAIRTVTEKMPGTVIEAELEKEDGKTVWEVKVVTAKGELKEVYVDVQSGKIVEIEEKENHKKGKDSYDQNDDDDDDEDDEESNKEKE